MSNNKDQYICGFADDHHFAQDSIFICCDVFSCKTCVESSEKDEFECKHCRKILKKKDILEPNKNYLNSISSSTEGDKLYRNLDEKTPVRIKRAKLDQLKYIGTIGKRIKGYVFLTFKKISQYFISKITSRIFYRLNCSVSLKILTSYCFFEI